ncbi:MAG: ABC1 kinase family protein [Candidatus Promineifilaceae bacterium]|jgi:predicted unusual protein kinase regulating ubiquinone biosynthesis (AarF/ABC1/UbiB family)
MGRQPTGKIERALAGGGTAARAGGRMLLHYAKRPFLGAEARRRAWDRAAGDSARVLFQGLSLLKGTALKMAQQLSLEMDMLPEAACHELAKAYHQVPPINRALARQVVREALGRPPEAVFDHFDLTAFAAASLGQVHRARDRDGTALAVKIQYPGIARTIDSDMALLRQILRPVIQSDQLRPMLAEVSARLHEEVDYLQEADNIAWFAGRLRIQGVRVPRPRPELSAGTVLTTTLMPGRPLDQWLESRPDPQAVDQVARTLQEIFITGLYELHVLHADPNPGNFIIADDLTVGLVDFGCIKRLDPIFVEHYRRLARAGFLRDDQEHYEAMAAMGFLPPHLEPTVREELRSVSDTFGRWFGRLAAAERFDFGAHPGFIAEGKAAMARFHHLRRHLTIDPDFLFLDRTRYGLLRLFEQMRARVCFRNKYEWE